MGIAENVIATCILVVCFLDLLFWFVIGATALYLCITGELTTEFPEWSRKRLLFFALVFGWMALPLWLMDTFGIRPTK